MRRSATLRPRSVIVLAIVLAALTHSSAFAQQAPNANAATVATANQADSDEAADVAKQLSNPIANLVSIPFQFNWQNHIAPLQGRTIVFGGSWTLKIPEPAPPET